MKKALIIIAFVGILAASLTSCSTGSHCPAYGSTDTVQQVDANV